MGAVKTAVAVFRKDRFLDYLQYTYYIWVHLQVFLFCIDAHEVGRFANIEICQVFLKLQIRFHSIIYDETIKTFHIAIMFLISTLESLVEMNLIQFVSNGQTLWREPFVLLPKRRSLSKIGQCKWKEQSF